MNRGAIRKAAGIILHISIMCCCVVSFGATIDFYSGKLPELEPVPIVFMHLLDIGGLVLIYAHIVDIFNWIKNGINSGNKFALAIVSIIVVCTLYFLLFAL